MWKLLIPILCLFSLQSIKANIIDTPLQIEARYDSLKGIGYDKGYTTLSAFLKVPYNSNKNGFPFLDLRGHVFDDGKLAANIGLGWRYLNKGRIFGINGYYDYRNTEELHYQQGGFGFETLGSVWDFRINGYIPFGTQEVIQMTNTFAGFQGHYLLASACKQFAMKGMNAEVGFRKNPFYVAAGPYYLRGNQRHTWGGQLRASSDLYLNYLNLEVRTSYDHFFKWVGQAQITLSIPLGCCRPVTLCQKLELMRIERFEIIPVAKQKEKKEAINPATGRPWTFFFVDNRSSSAGTFESPFPTLTEAERHSKPDDVIYVFPGDGSVRGMDQGIRLKNKQLFLGASIPQTVDTLYGPLVIPPQASTAPSITNLNRLNCVNLANGNRVSGFTFLISPQNGTGLFGSGITDLTATHNQFINQSSGNSSGIYLFNPSGRLLVENSRFSNFNNSGNGIFIGLESGLINKLNISKCQFNKFSGSSSGIQTIIVGGNLNSFNISCTQFNDLVNAYGIQNLLFGGVINSFNVNNTEWNNLLEAPTGGGSTGLVNLIGGGNIGNFTLSHCRFNNLVSSETIGIWNIIQSGSLGNYTVSNNVFNNIDGAIGITNVIFDKGNLNNCSIFSNKFNQITLTGQGSTGAIVHYDSSSQDAYLNITSNQFLSGSSLQNGYAVYVAVSGEL